MERPAEHGSLPGLMEAGQRIWVAGSSNEPTALLDRLAALELPPDLEFLQFPLAGYNAVDFTALSPTARFTTYFLTPALKGADPQRLQFLPMQMRAVFDHLAEGVDGVLLQVAQDRDGRLVPGPNVDFTAAALGRARWVAAELNASFTAPAGLPAIDPARVDCLVHSDRPLFELPSPAVDDTARAIGAHVAGLIRDGDTLQTGIGGIPAAILAALDQRNDLGMHGGLIDDGGMALIRNGNLTGTAKTIDRGVHVTGMALGSHALIDWLSQTPEVSFRGADYTHDVGVIRQLDNFVSINSAVEVDLFGQVNAEVVAGRQISGTGGSVDFMRGARASRGGRSIVALTATARGGSVSRIVPRVEMATALRTDVDIVVTEYGVAELRRLPAQARAEALIAIAAPDFRDELAGR